MKQEYVSAEAWFHQAGEYGFSVTREGTGLYQAWHLQYQPRRTAPEWLLHGEWDDKGIGWLSPLKLN